MSEAYLTVGCCLKGEESYILDFIAYHRAVGVERFVFLDRDYHPLHRMLDGQPNIVVLHYPEGQGRVHAQAWADLIFYNKAKTRWLALIDADQALVPVKTNDVREALHDYEGFASLQINWHAFGSGGAKVREPGSVYERFTRRANPGEPCNEHTQFICQPEHTLAERTDDPHHPKLPLGAVSVNTNKQPLDGPFNVPPLHDVLWVAHYINKSREEWEIKNAKGRCDIAGEAMPQNIWDEYEAIANAEDELRVLELWQKAVPLELTP